MIIFWCKSSKRCWLLKISWLWNKKLHGGIGLKYWFKCWRKKRSEILWSINWSRFKLEIYQNLMGFSPKCITLSFKFPIWSNPTMSPCWPPTSPLHPNFQLKLSIMDSIKDTIDSTSMTSLLLESIRQGQTSTFFHLRSLGTTRF